MPKAVNTGAGTIFIPNGAEQARTQKLKQDRKDREKLLKALVEHDKKINELEERIKVLENAEK